MRVLTVIMLVGMLVLGLVAGPALGQTCDTNYTGLNGGAWQLDGNWDAGEPDATKVACIAATKSVVIESDPFGYDAFAKAIVVSADATNTGELEIQPFSRLTISEDSTVDGIVTMIEKSQLFIAASLDITGNGGEIVGIPPGPDDSAGRIDHAVGAETAILTLRSATPGSRDTSLVVHGALTIAVELRNAAYVVADDGILQLTENTKWSSILGHWIAETGGDLIVLFQVRGPGCWLIQTGSGSSIKISTDCPLLTGDVVMTDGVLIADQDFLTTGNASIKSIDDGMGGFTEPKVQVAAAATVRFGS